MNDSEKTIEARLINCLNNNGIERLSYPPEYDSLTFITLVVDIENEFDIIFPDELLTFEAFGDLEILKDIIEKLMQEHCLDEHQT